MISRGIAIMDVYANARTFEIRQIENRIDSFCKNIFYKNIEAEICEILRIF